MYGIIIAYNTDFLQVIPVIGIMWSTFPCTSVKVNSLIGSVESDAFWCGEQSPEVITEVITAIRK